MNWLKYLVGFSALIIAGCAAFFSVTGLGVLFSGASTAVMVMAGALEFAKLVAATYLKQTWDEIKGFNKWYLVSAVTLLMLITSAGIFGYLSNAFQQQNIQLMQIEREVSVFDTKIKQNESEITRYTTQLTNQQNIRNSQESNLSKQIDKNVSTSRVSQMIRNADKEITTISAKINKLTEENNKNYEEINKIKNANIDIEKEVGGFRFVAEAFNVELAQVVKFFIFLIVLVFDPLAVALIIAFNGLIIVKRKEPTYDMGDLDDLMEKNYQIYGDNGNNSTNEEAKEVIVENILNKNEKDEINTETKENVVESDDVVDNAPLTNESLEQKLPELKWEEWMHPDYPWNNRKLWINNPKAVNYWMSNKGGSPRDLAKFRNEEENIKTY
jgi:hypothetical protein